MIASGAAAALEACEELRVVSLDIRGAHMYLVGRAMVTHTVHSRGIRERALALLNKDF